MKVYYTDYNHALLTHVQWPLYIVFFTVDFSVAQLKREMCERALTEYQNQLLRKEVESVRQQEHLLQKHLESMHREKEHLEQELDKEKAINKMVMKAASNHFESKITKYEGKLAQSNERNSELKRENQDMHQRLAKEKRRTAKQEEKLKSLKKKLLKMSSETRRGSSRSVVSDIEEDELPSDICSKMKTRSSQSESSDMEENKNSWNASVTSTDRLEEEEEAEEVIQGVASSQHSQDIPTECKKIYSA